MSHMKGIEKMKHTRWFGFDCMGNTPHAITIEGICIRDIYRPVGEQFLNQSTGERGHVYTGTEDRELHFIATKA